MKKDTQQIKEEKISKEIVRLIEAGIKESPEFTKGFKEGRKQALEEVEKLIDDCDCDKHYKIYVMDLKSKLKEMKK